MHKRTDHPLQRGGGVGDSGEDEDFEESLEELVCPPAIDSGLLQAQPDTE